MLLYFTHAYWNLHNRSIYEQNFINLLSFDLIQKHALYPKNLLI